MFDYNPLSSMMMFKAMSAGVSLEKQNSGNSISKPRVIRRFFDNAKSLFRAAMNGGLERYRLGQKLIAAKWRQVKALSSRSSLPE